LTAAGRALIDDADAAAQRTTLGLAAVAASGAAADVSGLAAVATSGSASDLGTGTLPIARIADGAVTLAKQANVATATIIGRTTAGTGVPEAMTAAQAKGVLAIASGDVSGLAATATSTDAANLSGSLAAARMPALTGDVTTSAGAVATTIAAKAVTLAKMNDIVTASVIGRNTAATGVPEVLTTLPTGVIPALTGDVTTPGGSLATTIAANAVSLAKMAQMATASFLGRTTAATGNVEVLTAAQATAMLNARTETLPGLMPANLGRKATLAANKSIANTLTQVVGLTAASGTLAVGTVIRFTGLGLLTNTTSASTSVLTLRINAASLGSTLEASWSCVLGITARTNCPFLVSGEIIIISTGGAGTAWGVLVVTCNTATALALPTTMVTAAVTCITNQSNVVELACISGAASTTWNFISASVEIINP
jgi:hypothetical protein